MTWMSGLVYGSLTLGLVFAVARLLMGPTLADRVVALELVASLTVGLIAAYSVFAGVASALDVAMVLALTGFLAAIAFARYLERRGADQ